MNATRAFLGDESAWPDARLSLDDVQGLWGGRRIFVAGTGRALVQTISRAMHERRFELALSAGETRALFALCVENDLLTIQPPERAGVPDESRPQITLTNALGERHTVSKWAGVREPRFVAIYTALYALETRSQVLEPAYSGRFDWEAPRLEV